MRTFRLSGLAPLVPLFFMNVKGEVSRKFDVILKPKNVSLTTETKNDCHPSAIKLSIIAPGKRQSRSEWIET